MFHIIPPSHIRALHTLTHLPSPISHGFSVCIVSCPDRMGHSHCYTIHPTPAFNAGDWDTIQPYLHHVFCLVCIRLSRIAIPGIYVSVRSFYWMNLELCNINLKKSSLSLSIFYPLFFCKFVKPCFIRGVCCCRHHHQLSIQQPAQP